MFAVDDAHYMDFESWEFVEALGNDNKSLVYTGDTRPEQRERALAYFTDEEIQEWYNRHEEQLAQTKGLNRCVPCV